MSELFEAWGRGLMGLFKELSFKSNNYVYLEHRMKSGWKASLPFYYAVCPEHGGYEAYPHGRGWVRCPKCFYEVLVPDGTVRTPLILASNRNTTPYSNSSPTN